MSYFRTLGRSLIGRAPTSIKASALGPAIARLMLHMPVWPKRDYELLAKEGYQQNVIVFRSVAMVAEAVAAVQLELHKGRGKRMQVIEQHPLIDLLRRPNPIDDGQALFEAIVSHWLITGNAYVERTNEEKLERMELYAHRPDRVRVVPGPQGFPEAYEFRLNGAIRRIAIDVDRDVRPVLHLKKFHPVDDWYGLSPLDPAAWAIDTHNGSGQFNKALLDNAATPSGAFVYSPKGDTDRLSDEQYSRLKSELDDQMSGSRNAGRPLLLEGGMDWKSMGIDPDKMQLVDSKHQAAREIALSLGVPPMLLGIPGDNTYSNYQEANRAFHRQTVIPLANRLARALTHWFGDFLDGDMRLEVDIDTIDALRPERIEYWQAVDKVGFLTTNEKRELLGFGQHPGADELYVGSGQIPVGESQAIAGGAAPDDTQDPPQKPANGSPAGRRTLN